MLVGQVLGEGYCISFEMEGVCVISLGILCSKSKSLLKSRGLFGVTRLFVDGERERVVIPLENSFSQGEF